MGPDLVIDKGKTSISEIEKDHVYPRTMYILYHSFMYINCEERYFFQQSSMEEMEGNVKMEEIVKMEEKVKIPATELCF